MVKRKKNLASDGLQWSRVKDDLDQIPPKEFCPHFGMAIA